MQHSNDVRILGLSTELQSHINLSPIMGKEYNVDLNFGTTKPEDLPGYTIRVNKSPAVALSRDRASLSYVLKSAGIPAFKCKALKTYYERDAFNMMKFMEEISLPCIFRIAERHAERIDTPSKVLNLVARTKNVINSSTVEETLDFDTVFVLHLAEPLIGLETSYQSPTFTRNDQGLVYASCLPKQDFFDPKQSRFFTDMSYSNFIKPFNWKEVLLAAQNAINKVGLDLAEVDMAYNRETHDFSVLDVKSHIKLDRAKRIGFSYSSCLEALCDAKRRRDQQA